MCGCHDLHCQFFLESSLIRDLKRGGVGEESVQIGWVAK